MIDLYNSEKEKTGKVIARGSTLLDGEYHLVSHIWIKNAKGEYLIQKRANTVTLLPNIWASTGGSVKSGEDSKTAIKRELFEEIGLDLEDLEPTLLFSRIYENRIWDIYFVNLEVDIKKLALQKEEVSDIMWASPKKINQMVKRGEFFNYIYLNELIGF